MDAVYTYEIIGLIIQILVGYYFVKKNWLILMKNIAFGVMVCLAVLVEVFDLIDTLFYMHIPVFLHLMLNTFIFLCLLMLTFTLMAYVLSIFHRMEFIRTRLVKFIFQVGTALCVLMFTTPWTGMMFENGKDGKIVPNVMLNFYCAFLVVYLVMSIIFMVNYRSKQSNINILLQISIHLICFLMILFQYLQSPVRMVLPFILACIILVYYMGLYNADQYLDYASGCFSRTGFYNIAEEWLGYRENIHCLSVCISNHDSISNYCLEEEIQQIHTYLGSFLHNKVNRHYVYRLHNSEYIIVMSSEKKLQALLDELVFELPGIIRLNDKNITVLYRFYQVNAKDADYDLQNFLRILVAMRNNANKVGSDRQIFKYDGQIRKNMELELEGIRKLNDNIHMEQFKLECMPIINVRENKVTDLEINPLIKSDDGEKMTLDTMWRLTREIGIVQDAALILWKIILRYVLTYQIFEHGIERVHINMPASCIGSSKICEEFIETVKEYHITPENIVLEIILDDDMAEEEVEKHVGYMRGQGIHVYLDRFGINACNFETVLKMPFDGVKIDGRLIGDIGEGGNRKFMYLLRMLRMNDWKICVNGMNYPKEYAALKRAEVDFAQGESFSPFLSQDETREFLLREGGVPVGI